MISLQKAKEALQASERKATELGIAISTTIVDNYGIVIASSKMDGAINISPKFAYSKALTSASIGMPTGDLGGFAVEGKPYYGLTDLFGGELTVISGGIPVKIDNRVVGGVGVGGAMDVSQDAECAKAAALVLESIN